MGLIFLPVEAFLLESLQAEICAKPILRSWWKQRDTFLFYCLFSEANWQRKKLFSGKEILPIFSQKFCKIWNYGPEHLNGFLDFSTNRSLSKLSIKSLSKRARVQIGAKMFLFMYCTRNKRINKKWLNKWQENL